MANEESWKLIRGRSHWLQGLLAGMDTWLGRTWLQITKAKAEIDRLLCLQSRCHALSVLQWAKRKRTRQSNRRVSVSFPCAAFVAVKNVHEISSKSPFRRCVCLAPVKMDTLKTCHVVRWLRIFVTRMPGICWEGLEGKNMLKLKWKSATRTSNDSLSEPQPEVAQCEVRNLKCGSKVA